MKNKSVEKIKKILLPTILLSVLFSGSSILFQLSQKALIGNQIGVFEIPTLKMYTILSQVIFVLILFIFSRYKPFEKVFKGTLLTLIGLTSLLAGLIFFQEHFQLNKLPETLGVYKPILTYWPISLSYIVFSLFQFNLFSLLIWGFINRITNLSEGIKYYIFLAVILKLTESLAVGTGMFMGILNRSLMFSIIVAIILMSCALIIFHWTWKKLPDRFIHPEEPPKLSNNRFPFLSGAYLLAGVVVIQNFLEIPFKSQMKIEFSTPAAYSKLMNYFTMSAGLTMIAVLVLWAILGTWLISKKGWKFTAIFSSISILVGGIVFFIISAATESVSWLNQGLFSGLLMGAVGALFFPLVQMLYLYLPYKNRFQTKIVTEMVILPLMEGVPLFVVQGLIVAFGSVMAISLYIKISSFILILFLILASRKAMTRLSI